MKKVIAYIAVSLDWYIARRDGSVDWLDKFNNEDYGFNQFIEGIDCALMGYNTYAKMLEFGPDAFKGRKHYVFSRKEGLKSHGEVEFVRGDLEKVVSKLKSSADKDLWLMGGGGLIKSFLSSNMVDELIIFVMPEILGSGLELFPQIGATMSLELKNTHTHQNGVVMLHYTCTSK